jgi:hypothetical protein
LALHAHSLRFQRGLYRHRLHGAQKLPGKNKRSITLDTKNPKGKEVLTALIKKCDVLVLRTVQSIAPPPNSIVPAFSKRCRGALRCSLMRLENTPKA